ncbi:choline transporter-like protein 2 isoform 1-T1 [Guaruba guarouba]
MAAAAPRSGAGGRAGCSWPQPGVRAPAPVPPARRFGAALAAGRVRVPAAAAAALCPGRFVTYTDVQASYGYKQDQWHYSKQFCKPGVSSPREPAAQVLRDGDCPSMIIPSRPPGVSEETSPDVRAQEYLSLT